MIMSIDIKTKCLHLESKDNYVDHYGSISYPIYQTATYAHPEVGCSTGFDYTRLHNPTRMQLEKTVAALEKGTDAQTGRRSWGSSVFIGNGSYYSANGNI